VMDELDARSSMKKTYQSQFQIDETTNIKP
jgi:hypothetical protein